MTLDLSTADFTGPHKNVAGNARTDYQGNRLTESERIRRKAQDASPTAAGDEEEEEEADGPDARQQQGRAGSRSPGGYRASAQNEEGNDDDEEPDTTAELSEKVQIMELHSPSPVISYKGRVYEGQWSQHVGTEFLLTRRDKDRDNNNDDGNSNNNGDQGNSNASANVNALPVVRHLENGVDLLAASSARITVTQREPREIEEEVVGGQQQQQNQERGLPPRRQRQRQRAAAAGLLAPDEQEALERWIPRPETKPSAARVAQSGFLARLIALKRRRGDKDAVPVLVNGHVRDLYVGGARRRTTADGVVKSSSTHKTKPKGGRRPGVGGKGGARIQGRDRDRRGQQQQHQHGAGVGANPISPLPGTGGAGPSPPIVAATATVESTPTPARWDDLRAPGSGSGGPANENEDDDVRMGGDDDDHAGVDVDRGVDRGILVGGKTLDDDAMNVDED